MGALSYVLSFLCLLLSLLMGELPFNGRWLGAGEPEALRREHPGNGRNGPDRSESRKGELRQQIPDI
jgi:hypothetical protein